VNERTEYTPGGDVLACCWLSSQHSEEEFGDTLLAVAGRDNSVSVISVVTSAVVALLKGHTKVIQARGALTLCVSFAWLRDARLYECPYTYSSLREVLGSAGAQATTAGSAGLSLALRRLPGLG